MKSGIRPIYDIEVSFSFYFVCFAVLKVGYVNAMHNANFETNGLKAVENPFQTSVIKIIFKLISKNINR